MDLGGSTAAATTTPGQTGEETQGQAPAVLGSCCPLKPHHGVPPLLCLPPGQGWHQDWGAAAWRGAPPLLWDFTLAEGRKWGL